MGTDRTSQQTGERAEAGRMVTPLAGKGTPSQEQVWRGAGLDCAWDRPSMSCLRREGAAVLRSPWEPLGWRCLDGSPPEHGDGDGADREKRVSTRERKRTYTVDSSMAGCLSCLSSLAHGTMPALTRYFFNVFAK